MAKFYLPISLLLVMGVALASPSGSGSLTGGSSSKSGRSGPSKSYKSRSGSPVKPKADPKTGSSSSGSPTMPDGPKISPGGDRPSAMSPRPFGGSSSGHNTKYSPGPYSGFSSSSASPESPVKRRSPSGKMTYGHNHFHLHAYDPNSKHMKKHPVEFYGYKGFNLKPANKPVSEPTDIMPRERNAYSTDVSYMYGFGFSAIAKYRYSAQPRPNKERLPNHDDDMFNHHELRENKEIRGDGRRDGYGNYDSRPIFDEEHHDELSKTRNPYLQYLSENNFGDSRGENYDGSMMYPGKNGQMYPGKDNNAGNYYYGEGNMGGNMGQANYMTRNPFLQFLSETNFQSNGGMAFPGQANMMPAQFPGPYGEYHTGYGQGNFNGEGYKYGRNGFENYNIAANGGMGYKYKKEQDGNLVYGHTHPHRHDGRNNRDYRPLDSFLRLLKLKKKVDMTLIEGFFLYPAVNYVEVDRAFTCNKYV